MASSLSIEGVQQPGFLSNNLGNQALINQNFNEFHIKEFNESYLNQIKEVLLEVQKAGFFAEKDTSVALDVLKEKLLGLWNYDIKVIEAEGIVLGFICYTKATLSDSYYELYWMAVRPSAQGKGLGRRLIEDMEKDIKSRGGEAILLDTSSLESHAAARHLYEKMGYKIISKIENFYSKGEHKLVYKKELN